MATADNESGEAATDEKTNVTRLWCCQTCRSTLGTVALGTDGEPDQLVLRRETARSSEPVAESSHTTIRVTCRCGDVRLWTDGECRWERRRALALRQMVSTS